MRSSDPSRFNSYINYFFSLQCFLAGNRRDIGVFAAHQPIG
jgi:hypothetical protein